MSAMLRTALLPFSSVLTPRALVVGDGLGEEEGGTGEPAAWTGAWGLAAALLVEPDERGLEVLPPVEEPPEELTAPSPLTLHADAERPWTARERLSRPDP